MNRYLALWAITMLVLAAFGQEQRRAPEQFNAADFPNDKFQITEFTHQHRAVTIHAVQAKRTNNDYSSSPSYCSAFVDIERDGQLLNSFAFVDIEPVGGSYGLQIPPQPSDRYFAILKYGDYDGRLLLIEGDGSVHNLPGGRFFVDRARNLLFSEYDSDLSELTVFDLGAGTIVLQEEVPYIFQWYTDGRRYFFTADDVEHNSEIRSTVYVFNPEIHQIIKEQVTERKLRSVRRVASEAAPNSDRDATITFEDCAFRRTK